MPDHAAGIGDEKYDANGRALYPDDIMLPEWTVIGFSGHRNLARPDAAAAGISRALERLAAIRAPLAAVSSAASGSDTLFVEEIARRNLPYLLVLPFSRTRFQRDFSAGEWQRISPLIEKAVRIEEIAGEEASEEAYMETGVLTVDRADVMVVVWDGQPAAGLGGTGDVVDYARKLQRPLILIDPNSGQIVEERLEQLPVISLPVAGNENPREAVENHFQELDRTAELHAPKSRLLIFRIIVFQLAASALGFFALVFGLHDRPGQAFASVELVLLLVAVVLSSQHRKKHLEWMKNRIAAEICRSFLATWDMRQRADHFPKLSIQGYGPLCRNLWLIRTMDRTPPLSLETARGRYLEERVKMQIAYFSRRGDSARTTCRRLKTSAVSSTVLATLLSLSLLTLSVMKVSGSSLAVLKYLSMLLPLLGAACFSLMITQDYSRRAMRYDEMVLMLEEVAKRLALVKTWNSLMRVATETEEQLLQEVVEWHTFRQFAGELH
jgi:hypothetical protein